MKVFPFSIFGEGVKAGVVQTDVASALPFPAHLLQQVHGTEMVEVEGLAPSLRDAVLEADAMMTRRAGVRLMIKSVDCIPLVLADEEAGLVAAVHAGWRGLMANIVPLAIARLVQEGAVASRIRVGIGPSLGVECAEFSEPFSEIPTEYHWAISGQQVDLWAILERQLREAGVEARHVEWMRVCTACSPEWFSWRRDHDARRFGTWIELTGFSV